MAEQTNIEWCDSTFNPWIGCARVSLACDDCYAARSTPARTLGVAWGAGQPRRRTSGSTWDQPAAWQRQAPAFYAVHGRRRRVFCASLADWLDNEVPIEWLVDLLQVVHDTPALDWLLLTKRIGNWERRISEALHHVGQRHGCLVDPLFHMLTRWLRGEPPLNVWLGATVVNQPEFDRDVLKLLRVPAAVRFLSVEPMLGPIYLRSLRVGLNSGIRWVPDAHDHVDPLLVGIDWVICGGESGPKARPMHPDWARRLRDQCAAAGVAFMFKQHGEWAPGSGDFGRGGFITAAVDRAGRVAPGGVSVHDYPARASSADGWSMVHKAGKKVAGRMLDGVEHNGFPEVRHG